MFHVGETLRGPIEADQEGYRLHTRGLNWGYANGSMLRIVFAFPTTNYVRHAKYLILKCKGTRDWSQVGSTKYHPAEYALVRVLDRWGRDGTIFEVEVISSEAPGSKWRSCIQRMKEQISQEEA